MEQKSNDPIIRVNRYAPVFPSDTEEVLYDNLRTVGPDEYDLAKDVGLWLHDDQKGGKIKAMDVFRHLANTDMLKKCLGLHDWLEIAKKDPRLFADLSQGTCVFFWRNVRKAHGGQLYVPHARGGETGNQMMWFWLGHELQGDCPAAMFK